MNTLLFFGDFLFASFSHGKMLAPISEEELSDKSRYK